MEDRLTECAIYFYRNTFFMTRDMRNKRCPKFLAFCFFFLIRTTNSSVLSDKLKCSYVHVTGRVVIMINHHAHSDIKWLTAQSASFLVASGCWIPFYITSCHCRTPAALLQHISMCQQKALGMTGQKIVENVTPPNKPGHFDKPFSRGVSWHVDEQG